MISSRKVTCTFTFPEAKRRTAWLTKSGVQFGRATVGSGGTVTFTTSRDLVVGTYTVSVAGQDFRIRLS